MIRNGQIWESPSKLTAIVQELAADLFIMLGTPAPVLGGGTAMQPVRWPTGRSFHTREELESALKGWKQRQDLRLDWM